MGKAAHYKRGSLAERFWPKVEIGHEGQCWEWRASLDTHGYGNFGIRQADGTYLMQRAHRVAWFLHHGEWLQSKQFLCHSCDNPRCVNPAHLSVGDAKTNMRDASLRQRFPDRKGASNNRAVLDDLDVLFIRGSDMTPAQVASQFNLSKSTAHAVVKGATWRHLQI